MTRSEVAGGAGGSDQHPGLHLRIEAPVGPPEEAPAARRLHPVSPLLDLLDRNALAPGVIALGSGGVRILVGALVAIGLLRALT